MLTLHAQDNKTFLLLCKSLEDPKFFAFFFGKKKGLQKFRGKFYVLAALSDCVLSRRFGNPLQKFFCGFGFVEFLMRSAPLPKGVWGWSACVFGYFFGCVRAQSGFFKIRIQDSERELSFDFFPY